MGEGKQSDLVKNFRPPNPDLTVEVQIMKVDEKGSMISEGKRKSIFIFQRLARFDGFFCPFLN